MNLLSCVLLFVVVVAFAVALRYAFFSRKSRRCCRGGDCEKCKTGMRNAS